MTLKPTLNLRVGQSLAMTPQMQQAVKLLQMNNIELAEFIADALEKNPLLESREEDDAPADLVDEHTPKNTLDAEETLDFSAQHTTAEIDVAGGMDMEVDNLYNNSEGPQPAQEQEMSSWEPLRSSGVGGVRAGGYEDLPSLEETLAQEVSLRHHIEEQIAVEIGQGDDRLIATYLAGMLDERGRLDGDAPEQVAETLGAEVSHVMAVLHRLQQFDPVGIFARSLEECLALQLKEKNRLDPAMQAMLENLPLVAARDGAALKKVCGVSSEDIVDMLEEIRALNPVLPAQFMHDAADVIRPDILMNPRQDGSWHLELNPETLPKVLVNNAYYTTVSVQMKSRHDKNYITDCYQQASWIVRAMHQRAKTVLAIAETIVIWQQAFFRLGIGHLKPLILQDIAEEVNLHESTVSRATAGKYMATPRGVFELRYFFSAGLRGSDGEEVSSRAVKERIRQMINAELPDAILSDDKIAALLQDEGTDVARRTVAKYREVLGLGSSVERRRMKKHLISTPAQP